LKFFPSPLEFSALQETISALSVVSETSSFQFQEQDASFFPHCFQFDGGLVFWAFLSQARFFGAAPQNLGTSHLNSCAHVNIFILKLHFLQNLNFKNYNFQTV
jgi:hypothetical protein